MCSHAKCIILLLLPCILYHFTYKTLWCKWQLTFWVGVNAVVHNEQLGKKITSDQQQQQCTENGIRIYRTSSALNCLLQTSCHGSIIAHKSA